MKQEARVLIGLVVMTVVLMAGGVTILSNSNSGQTEVKAAVDQALLIRPDSHQISTESAVVTIVEFGDLQCPACRAAHPLVKQIMKDFPGRVNYVSRHFVLPQHINGMSAAKAAEAAGEQGKYFEMVDLLYEKQLDWEESKNPNEIFVKYAQSLQLDSAKFEKDLNNDNLKNRIEQDKTDGLKLGINSTPTFFINGQKFTGALNYNAFKNLIEPQN